MSSTMVFPAGRSLAEWWTQLASVQPKACWLAYLFVHQIEARVRCRTAAPLERLHRLVLRAVEMMEAAPLTPSPSPSGGEGKGVRGEDFCRTLDQRLYLGEAALRQLLRQLQAARLVEEKSPGVYRLSEHGRTALASGFYSGERLERRTFPFVERVNPAGDRLEPHYLPLLGLQGGKGEAWQVNGEHYFDPAWLTGCVQNSADWKRNCSFPADVLDVVDRREPESWEDLIIDRTERVPVALAETGGQLLGFAIHLESWRLLASAPIITLANWQEVFPMLVEGPPLQEYQQAWRAFAHERNIAPADAEACTVTPGENAARVAVPARLADPFRKLRSDAAKGHAWMLVGAGAVRKIVRVTIEFV